MDAPEQALAYAEADFSEPHDHFVELFQTHFGKSFKGQVLDLGCGPADICVRFAQSYPDCMIHGVDGAASMLALGRQRIRRFRLDSQIQLFQSYLPETELPRQTYDALISNSLLHHLQQPETLWHLVHRHACAGSIVFIMDLRRPESAQQARQLVDDYAADETDILRTDFYNSLRAAYRPDEVQQQLVAAQLDALLQVDVVSDRHLTVTGRLT